MWKQVYLQFPELQHRQSICFYVQEIADILYLLEV